MRVEDIVAQVFSMDPSDVTDQSSKETIQGWDSMGHLSLITGLEEAFKVSIAISDAMDMTSVKKIKSILADYGISS